MQCSRISQLSQNEWVIRGQNLLITGPCGCGRIYGGYAPGNNACQQGYSEQYCRLSRLLVELTLPSRWQLQEAACTAVENVVVCPG
nr:ATP-binding protein [Klebsiella variicola]